MNIQLKKRYADWIAEQIGAGRYASEIEAVEDALAAKIDEEEVAYFRERRRMAEEDIKAGRTVVADDAFFERKKQRIRDLYMKRDE